MSKSLKFIHLYKYFHSVWAIYRTQVHTSKVDNWYCKVYIWQLCHCPRSNENHKSCCVKASLTFKCMTEHLFADFSYSISLDTYLRKQMMQMNRKLIHIWYNVDKKHLLFTKRKCHKFSWLFMESRCSPRRRSICACRIACKVLVSIGL